MREGREGRSRGRTEKSGSSLPSGQGDDKRRKKEEPVAHSPMPLEREKGGKLEPLRRKKGERYANQYICPQSSLGGGGV